LLNQLPGIDPRIHRTLHFIGTNSLLTFPKSHIIESNEPEEPGSDDPGMTTPFGRALPNRLLFLDLSRAGGVLFLLCDGYRESLREAELSLLF
jgi:hypothetical protein